LSTSLVQSKIRRGRLGSERQFITLSARANLWHFVAMPSPTSPRKRALMPSAPLRRALRGAGHALDPVVQIGRQGVTDSVVAQITRALLDHELIKVKLGSECPDSRFEVAERLSGESGVRVAQILGRTILLYKRRAKRPQFEPSQAAPDGRSRVKRNAREP
jgi:RNA-binding protein